MPGIGERFPKLEAGMAEESESHEAAEGRFCSHCGAACTPGARFCPSCGKRVTAEAFASADTVIGGKAAPASAETVVAPRLAPPPPPRAPVAVAPSAAAVAIQRPCPNCRREFGPGIHCQFCDQVDGLSTGVPLSSSGRRLGAHLLDGLLIIVTLYIGWLIWTLIVAARGQSPGKQLLGMRVVKIETMSHATWWTMFVREVLLKSILFGLIVTFTVGIGLLSYMWLIWDKNRQELWDKMINTIVVNDPNKQVA